MNRIADIARKVGAKILQAADGFDKKAIFYSSGNTVKIIWEVTLNLDGRSTFDELIEDMELVTSSFSDSVLALERKGILDIKSKSEFFKGKGKGVWEANAIGKLKGISMEDAEVELKGRGYDIKTV